ncbi:GLABROUS1 enhancer-binding protein-like [Corylus avellana]|uniref:GLABROUS1 enhancer-binding protein-like n=1 Tax=Corylus avellana TaxID=13451 RepID=UPI001E226C73|nr:GLABROUS1 enhancer-binding protein-like [Corylus avellana]XP_059435684.1 GLABROUS1 enhancer-binding protein-like [Corylus avellana]
MAPKRPSHLEDPPAASSSEEEASSEEEEGSSSSEEEEEEAEAEKASSLPSTPVTEKKSVQKKPDPEPQSSSSGSGSDSDTDSGATPNQSVKPIASKPMEDSGPKATTKPRSKPASSAARSLAATKRPSSETDSKDSTKRAKKKAPEPSADGVVSPDNTKKSTAGDEKKLFQRVWSEGDEIAILKGMLEFAAKRGADPITDAVAFHEFVKKSLHVDVTKTQLVDKIRRLKKKYNNIAERAKKGKLLPVSKAHEHKAFELSRKVWGSTEEPNEVNPVVETAKPNGKSPSKKSNQKGNTSRSLKEELLVALPVAKKNVAEKMEIDKNQGSGPVSGRSLNGMVRFDKSMGVVGLEESVIMRGLELIGEDKRAELEERWREVEMAELEVFVKRSELVRDQARLIWESYKKEANDH